MKENQRMFLELEEKQRERIKYLENKIREYESEIAQLKYFIKEKTNEC
jgi:cob(I)alamin adenosyltransferase